MTTKNQGNEVATKSDVRSMVGKETGVTVGLVVVIVASFVVWARSDASWKTNIERDVAEIRKDLAASERSGAHGWGREQMRLWAERFERLNPDSVIPSIDDIP